MDDLVRWLGEQLDADERIARAASGRNWLDGDGWLMNEDMHIAEVDDRPTLAHMAAHDPARVLREIDAKRRILYLAVQLPKVTASTDMFDNHRDAWAEVLKQLAAPYADRPGYRKGWAP